MEFRLVYQGNLPAAGGGGGASRLNEKQAIRRALHPQLRELWQTHPALLGTRENKHYMSEHLGKAYAK